MIRKRKSVGSSVLELDRRATVKEKQCRSRYIEVQYKWNREQRDWRVKESDETEMPRRRKKIIHEA